MYLGSTLEVSGSRSVAFLAGSLFAFFPGFAFRGGNISNDGLLTVTSAVDPPYWLILLRTRNFTWRRASTASLFIGIAFLTKVNSMILFPGLVLVLLSAKELWTERLKRLSTLFVGVALAGPWLIRK